MLGIGFSAARCYVSPEARLWKRFSNERGNLLKLGATVRDVNRRVAVLVRASTGRKRVVRFSTEQSATPIILVTLPAPFHRAAGGVGEVAAEGDTVAAALASLRRSHSAVARLVLRENDEPRRGVSLFLNGSDLRALGGLGTPLHPEDRLAVMLLMARG